MLTESEAALMDQLRREIKCSMTIIDTRGDPWQIVLGSRVTFSDTLRRPMSPEARKQADQAAEEAGE